MNGSFHDEQDRLLREAGRDHLAGADLPAEAADSLRVELGHGFARRRARRRRWTAGVAAVFIFGVTLVGFQTDVISEVLDFVFKKINKVGQHQFESVSTGARLSSPLDSTATMEEHLAFVETAHEARMAGLWKIGKVQGYTLRSETYFIVTYDLEVDGEPHNYYLMWPEEVSESWIEDWETAYDGPLAEMETEIIADRARELPSETVTVYEVAYEFDKYTATYPDWGEIVIWIARLPDQD